MPDSVSHSALAAHGIIAFFGAFVHAARAHREGNSKTLADFAILTAMSSFSGVMFALIGLYLFPGDAYISMALAGTGGFLGVEGMTIIVERVRSIIISK